MNELSLFNSLFNDFLDAAPATYYRNAYYSPKVDVKDEENGYTLEMELPGRTENDVNIELDKENLTIASKTECTKSEKKDKKENYILKERTTCDFKRKFTLPADVDSETITASFKNGILTINMQKKPIPSPKVIQISAS
ncbi:MAG: Hsp20 family protein [Treponema sp.]|nr:Hsp20 family protein [Treponema sp.]